MRQLASVALLLLAAQGVYAEELRTIHTEHLRSVALAAEPVERLRITGLRDADALSDLTATLERFEIWAPDARVVVVGAGGTAVQRPPAVTYLRGSLDGKPASRIVLAIPSRGEIRGLAADEHGTYLVSPATEAPGSLELRRATLPAGPDGVAPATCAGAPVPPQLRQLAAHSKVQELAAPAAATATYTARVAIETDFEYYDLFDDVGAAVNYAGDLIAFISAVYEAEVSTSLLIPYIRIWTTAADPWIETSFGCHLLELGKVWNDSQGAVSRTITHMLSGKPLNYGIAWIGVLCDPAFSSSPANIGVPSCSNPLVNATTNSGGAYGFTSSIYGGFLRTNLSPAAAIIWDTVAVAHEIGHNFNSPHTHCYQNIGGNSSAVDRCVLASGCYVLGETSALPGTGTITGGSPGSRNGTIMSYCHLYSDGNPGTSDGGMSNLAFTFGAAPFGYGVAPARVPARMSSHVTSMAASFPTCLAATISSSLFSDGFEKDGNLRWDVRVP